MDNVDRIEDEEGNLLPNGRKFKATLIFYDNECLTTDKPEDVGAALKEIVNDFGAEVFVTDIIDIEEMPR
jgi:hypothetical protein